MKPFQQKPLEKFQDIFLTEPQKRFQKKKIFVRSAAGFSSWISKKFLGNILKNSMKKLSRKFLAKFFGEIPKILEMPLEIDLKEFFPISEGIRTGMSERILKRISNGIFSKNHMEYHEFLRIFSRKYLSSHPNKNPLRNLRVILKGNTGLISSCIHWEISGGSPEGNAVCAPVCISGVFFCPNNC